MKTLDKVYKELSKIEDEMYVKRCCGSCDYCPFDMKEELPCIYVSIIRAKERVQNLIRKLEDL